jgi:hypothetical protein
LFKLEQFQQGPEPVPSALLFHVNDDSPQNARIPAAQQLLFPTSPRAVCEELGLNWWAVLKLHEDRWLSFSPELVTNLDEAQEAELRFIGSLVVAGCDRNMLIALLARLPKPYSYDVTKVYFDWAARRWRLLPDPRHHPEAAFADWLEALVQANDASSLSGIEELARDALSRLLARTPQPELEPKHWKETTDSEQLQG